MKENKKFELTDISVFLFGRKVSRIRSLVDFETKSGNVKVGDLGGYVESERNLSHEGNAWVYGDAMVCDNAEVYENAEVCGNAMVYGDAKVCGNAMVYGDAKVCGNAMVYGDAKVCGNAMVYGDAKVCGNAELFERNHFLIISNIGSRNGTTAFFRGENNEIHVACSCFHGTIDDFLKKVKETHGNNKHAKAYTAAIELAKIQIGQYGLEE